MEPASEPGLSSRKRRPVCDMFKAVHTQPVTPQPEYQAFLLVTPDTRSSGYAVQMNYAGERSGTDIVNAEEKRPFLETAVFFRL